MSNEPRQLRPELLRIAGTFLAAIIIVIGLIFNLGTAWLLLALIVYGVSTVLFGLAVVRNWRGIGAAHRRGGTVGYTGWVQIVIGTVMIVGALVSLAVA